MGEFIKEVKNKFSYFFPQQNHEEEKIDTNSQEEASHIARAAIGGIGLLTTIFGASRLVSNLESKSSIRIMLGGAIATGFGIQSLITLVRRYYDQTNAHDSSLPKQTIESNEIPPLESKQEAQQKKVKPKKTSEKMTREEIKQRLKSRMEERKIGLNKLKLKRQEENKWKSERQEEKNKWKSNLERIFHWG